MAPQSAVDREMAPRLLRGASGAMIVALGSALASYAVPIADAGTGLLHESPVRHFLFRPHIDNLESSWGGQPVRLLLMATIWCLATTLIMAVGARRNPRTAASRWLVALSLASTGLSVGVLVALRDYLGEGAMAPGAILACGLTGGALLGALILNHRRPPG
ncbi:MAG TPA: hypothetical protein VGE07_00910 [Herpetosiphonaceae bacterium]